MTIVQRSTPWGFEAAFLISSVCSMFVIRLYKNIAAHKGNRLYGKVNRCS
jgi:hypothetical protein